MINVQVKSELVNNPVIDATGGISLGLKGLRVLVTHHARLSGEIDTVEEFVRRAQAGDTVVVDGQLVFDAVISATQLQLIPRPVETARLLAMPLRRFGRVGQ